VRVRAGCLPSVSMLVWGALGLSSVSGCSHVSTSSAILSGSAILRQSARIPDDAVFEATLEESAGRDGPLTTISRIRHSPAGQPPYQFALRLDPDASAAGRTFVVRVHLESNGEILYRSAARINEPAKRRAPLHLTLRKAAPEATVTETVWTMREVAGASTLAPTERAAPQLVTHPKRRRVAAMGFCNNMVGTFIVRQRRVRFLPMPGTLLPCIPPSSADDAVLRAFASSVEWRFADGVLELRDSRGACTARFSRAGGG